MNKRGFTLIELMIVIIVISGLMYLIIPNVTSTKANLEGETCDAYVELVNTQILQYYLDNDSYPADLQILVSGEYIKSETCSNGTIINYDSLTGEASLGGGA